jgi:hypothetical protein
LFNLMLERLKSIVLMNIYIFFLGSEIMKSLNPILYSLILTLSYIRGK